MNPLEQFSDAELQAECDRRVKIAREKYEAEQRARQVEIVCPFCNGSGETVRDSVEGVSRWTCESCKGRRTMLARRAT